MIRLPTAVEPVKRDLAHQRVGRRSARPTTEPLPGMTVNTPSGRPASSASSPSRIAVSGVSSAGLSTTVLPAASAGREAPAGDRHREVPRHDDADDAERLVEGHVEAAGDRDLPAEQPLRRGRVVVQAVPDVAGLPGRVAERVPGVARPRARRAPRRARRRRPRSGAAAGPARPARRRARPGRPCVRALDQRVGLASEARGTSVTACSVAGLTTVSGSRVIALTSARSRGGSSQSVTAASNAAQLDVGHVRVVVDHVVAEGRAGHLGARRTRPGPRAACAAPWASEV